MSGEPPFWPSRIAQLRKLWRQTNPQLSAAAIGRHFGCSKNAIIGAAHRYDLPARHSPIVRNATPKPPPVPRAPAITLPSLAAPPRPPAASNAAAKRDIPAPRQLTPVYVPRPTSCVWPLGEVGTRHFRFCEDPSMPGKPYCPDHCCVAYVKTRDRREDDVIANVRAREAA